MLESVQLAVYICLNFSEELESEKNKPPPPPKNLQTEQKQTTLHENQDWDDIS